MNQITQNTSQEVSVTSFYYPNGNTKRSFPRRIEFADSGRQLSFIENGLRCIVQKGQDLIEIFTMSDGNTSYRLRHETNSHTWILLAMKPYTTGEVI